MPAQVRASTSKAPVAVYPMPPVTAAPCDQAEASTVATLVLQDGSSYQGISFGAETKSISGECVFQTGKHSIHVRCMNFAGSSRRAKRF